MSGHTPGPWKIVPRSRAEDGGAYPAEIVSDDEREFHITPLEAGVIAQLALDNPGSFWGDSDVKKANARLIAAAPVQHAELLACKQFLEDMHTQTAEWTVAESQKRHAAVCAAIAAATGEKE